MKETFYLVINKNGADRIRKSRPALNAGEIAAKLTLSISDKFFERFIPSAELEIPDNFVIEPNLECKVEDFTEEKHKIELEVKKDENNEVE